MEREGVTFYESYSEFLEDQFGVELSEEIAEEVIERADCVEKYGDFSDFENAVMNELKEMYPCVPEWLWSYFNWDFEQYLQERSADGDFDVYEFRNGKVIRVWCGGYDEIEEVIEDILEEFREEGEE